MSLAWVGCEFPPQLALIHTDSSDDNQVCNIPPGMLLVASTLMEEQSMFYQSVVLILAHDPEESTKGVILNLSANLNQQIQPNPQPFSNIPNYSGTNEIKGLCDAVRLNIGGPIETDFFVVLHNDPNCNKHSTEVRWRRNDEEPLTAAVQNSPEEDSNTNAAGQRSMKQHRLFFAEYEAAFQTMRLWSAEHSPSKNMNCDTASSQSSDHFSGDWRERERGLSEREVYSDDGGSSSGSGVYVPRLLRPSKRQQHRSYDSVLKADNTSHSHSHSSSAHFSRLYTGMSSIGAPCSAAPCMSVFRGHCTWAPGQLAGELQAGLWLVVSDEKIKARVLGAAGACSGSSSSAGMWNSLLRQLDDHW